MPFSHLRNIQTHKLSLHHLRLSQEALESCQTRVSKLELQQQQQQQTVQLESHDARVLLGKSINIMLAIITVILVCVSTAAKFAAPLMRSRHHVVATFLGVCFLTIFWKNWDRLQHTIDGLLVPAWWWRVHTSNNITWTLSVVRIGLSKRIGCTIVRRHEHYAFTEDCFF